MASNKSYFKMGEMYCYNEIKIIQNVTMGSVPFHSSEGTSLRAAMLANIGGVTNAAPATTVAL